MIWGSGTLQLWFGQLESQAQAAAAQAELAKELRMWSLEMVG